MSEHKQFEILCALAVVGQVSDAEMRELKQHLEACADCRTRISDFAQISSQALPLSGQGYMNVRFPKAMTARFLERARAEGIPVRQRGNVIPNGLFAGSWTGRLAMGLLVITIIAGCITKSGRYRDQAAGTIADQELVASLQTSIADGRSVSQRANAAPSRGRVRISNTYLSETVRPLSTTRLSGHNEPFAPDTASSIHYLIRADSQFSSNIFRRVRAPGIELNDSFPKFAIMLPLQDIPFKSNQALFDSPRATIQWHPDIDWSHVRLQEFHLTSSPNSNKLPRYPQGVFGRQWPSFNEPKVEMQ